MKKAILLIMLILFALSAAGCAAGPNEFEDTPDEEGEVAGFWLGLWHGVISPITFLVSLFRETVNIYEVHNNGGWYNFGFMVGVSIVLGTSGGGAARRRR